MWASSHDSAETRLSLYVIQSMVEQVRRGFKQSDKIKQMSLIGVNVPYVCVREASGRREQINYTAN